MAKHRFLPFDNDLTDNRLDALRRVKPDIFPLRSPAPHSAKKSWQQFIKRLFSPFDCK